MPAPFRIPGFTGLWVGTSSAAFSRVVTQLALSWVTLEATGSPFAVGVVMAARSIPQMVIGIPAGVLADWFDRRLLMAAANGLSAVLLVGLIGLAGSGLLTVPVLVGVSVCYGILDTVRMSATQAYAYELVRSARATSGMALTNLGNQLLSTVGGLAGGFTLERFGGPTTFGVIALAALLAAAAPYVATRRPTVSPDSRDAVFPPTNASTEGQAEPRPAPRPERQAGIDFGRAMTLLIRNRVLAVLSLAIILAEIFGFATQTLLPTFARDVFEVGASGLGVMMAVRSAGGTFGLLVLSRLGAEGRAGLVFIIGAGGFGLALLLFAVSPIYALALVLLALSGSCASIMDTLGQTLLQRNADERERGAAMGIWVFSVGFGPVGHLTLGAAATSLGAPVTQAVSGLMLMLAAAGMALHGSLRRAR